MHRSMAEQLIADRLGRALARPGWRRRLRIGTTVLAAATVAFAGGPAELMSAPTGRHGTEAGTLVGLRAMESEPVFYAPGASRTWAPGPQTIAVKVISGRLSVYGVDGERWVYKAGEGYAAGWVAHRAVNETDERVETLVTNHVRP